MTKIIRTAIQVVVTVYILTANPVFSAPGYNSGQSLPTVYNQTIDAELFGVIANDGADDAPAIQSIIDSIDINNPANNLIRISLPAGEINIGEEVHVDRSGIIIVGAGSDPVTGTKIVINSWQPYSVGSGNEPDFDKKYWPGFAAFRAETRLKHRNEQAYEGSINYHWKHSIEFGAPASQGDTVLKMDTNGGDKFAVGDLIYVGAANDDAFLDLGQVPSGKRNNSNIKIGHMRTQIFTVVAINESDNEVTIDKPLEFDVPLQSSGGYNSRAMPVTAVEGVGFRDFYITMDNAATSCENNNAGNYSVSNPMGVGFRYENVCAADAIHGIIFKYAYNGFVDNVMFEMVGSHPIVTEFAKNMTFSNNTIDGSWNKGAGGNGYFRGSKLYDSVISGNTIDRVRHLTLQWSATGNIVENNYLSVDLNLHGGWERNNIIRNNTIEVPFEHRSWSSGAPGPGTWQPIWYASGDHASNWAGPTGPNNVFINNTLKKALNEGASITTWGLFDTPNIAYHFAWDGAGFLHLNTSNNGFVSTWTQALAEAVHNEMPGSGVYIETINTNDNDNDGVLNADDQCPNTPAGTPVDSLGCALVDGDDDADGVLNSVDLCPNTPSGAMVDANGCEIVDGDDDGDGVLNSVDLCPNTAAGVAVDANGCEQIATGCAATINVPWGARTEVSLPSPGSCIDFGQELTGETVQFWDSDTNSSCNFVGLVSSVDGTGSLTISSNYVSSNSFSGTTLKLEPSSPACPYIKVRAY